MNIYNIFTEYGEKLNNLMSMEDLPDDVLKDTKEALELEFVSNSKDFVAVMLNIESEFLAVKAASERLAKRESSLFIKYTNMKEILKEAMEKMDIKEIKTDEFLVKCIKGGFAVDVKDENLLPAEFFRIIPERKEPDKLKIKKELINGASIDGAQLIPVNKLLIK